jgi:cobalt-zinc-cadmium efflux system protein
MSCNHPEHHHHGAHAPSNRIRILWSILLLTTVYLVAEVIGGLITGSLALLADAGHMFADVAAIALALFATWFAQYPASPQKTYGYHRIEILAALLNGLALTGLSVWIIWEALERWASPPEVKGDWMLAVAFGGLLINMIAIRLLHGDHNGDLNMRGAYLHILGDLLGSIGTILAAVVILSTGFYLADPLISIVIALLIMASASKLVWETIHILLEGSPAHINVARVKEEMLNLCGVVAVHDLHVWTITSGKDALSAHVVVEPSAYAPETLKCIQSCLKEKFGVSHATVQLEPPDFEEDEVHF